jgi:hypothetical protein
LRRRGDDAGVEQDAIEAVGVVLFPDLDEIAVSAPGITHLPRVRRP